MSSIFNSKAKLTVLVAGLLLVAAAALYHQLLTGSYHFSGPDSLSPKAVGTGLRALEAESGEMPTWMPWVFSGLPTVHSFTSVSALYMPYLITKPLVGLGMPGFWVFLLHLIFGGLGTYVLVRRLGGTFAAGLLSGSGFMLMPYTNTMIVHGHGSQMMTLVYLPWVIWALVRLYEDRNLISTAWLTLLVGLMLQRGHVQIAYYALMLAGLMALVMIVRLYRDADRGMTEAGKFTGTFALAMLLAFSLAAALFIPAMEYTPYSIRGAQAGGGVGFDYATQWSFSLGESLTFIAPSFYGFGGVTYWGNMPFTDYPNYMGLLLLGLAIWAVYRRRDWLTLTLASASIIAFLVSLGHNFFLYRLLYNILPFFNKFRVPVMILVIPQFSVAVLAGLGLDDLLKYMEARKPDEVRQFIIRLSIGVLGGGILLMVASAMLAGNFPPS
ncbi:MAG: hypothetical protein KAU50_06670, partial [Candidatus Marinimicrobia bacterium]|nr:hypothetical protein [Candidatus Neomarinimicrobiota bacterium]